MRCADPRTPEDYFETSPAAMFLVNPEGRITFANQRMADLFSIPLEDLTNRTVCPVGSSRGTIHQLRQDEALMSGEIDLVSLERRYVRDDGIEFLGHLSGRRFGRTDGGLEAWWV